MLYNAMEEIIKYIFLYAVTAKQCLLRNSTLAIGNGAVSFVILLIAPLGLAAVITNTVLIVVATRE